MSSTNHPPDLTPNYPCLNCNSPQISNYFPEKSPKKRKGRKSSGSSSSLKNFLLSTLLELPPEYLTSDEFSDDAAPWLNICEPCYLAVKQAEQIHTEIQVATQKFRNCQESLVTILKKSLTSGAPSQPIKEETTNPYQLCRQFANHHNFNDFGYPFIVDDPNCPSTPQTTTLTKRPPPPPQMAPPSPSPPKKISKKSKLPPPAPLPPPQPPIPITAPQKIQMTRALFLNVSAVTDLLSASGVFSKTLPPFILVGTVPREELPPPFNFSKNLLPLISGRYVDFQKKKKDNIEDRVLLGSKVVWTDSDGDPPEGRIYYMSDMHSKEEMLIVGQAYQQWKEVGGVLSYLHPGLNCIANVGFIFSERKSCLGLHMEDLRFSSVNILFQGRKQWDIVHPEDNEKLIIYLKDNHKGEELGEEEGCDWWVLHKNIWIGEETRQLFRVSSVVQEVGDVVMVPPGVLHQVRNLEDCVAASYNFVDGMWVQERDVFEGCSCGHKGGRTVLGVGDVNRLKEAHFQVNLYARYHGSGGVCWGPEHRFYSGKATAEFFDGVGEEVDEEEKKLEGNLKGEGEEGNLNGEAEEGSLKIEGEAGNSKIEKEEGNLKIEEGPGNLNGEGEAGDLKIERGEGVNGEGAILDLRVGAKIESELEPPKAEQLSCEEKMVVNE